MKKIILLIAAACGFVIVGNFGAWALRANVAGDKIVERIDGLLGTIDIKQKRIDNSVAGLDEALTEMRKAKVRAEVKLDQMRRTTSKVHADIVACDKTLQVIRGHLEKGTTVDIAGRSYSQNELSLMAERVLGERDSCSKKREGLDVAEQRLENVVMTLERKLSDADRRKMFIQNQLAVIDSDRIALNAMKDASLALKGHGKTLPANIEQLERQVNDLYADVEAELAVENYAWQDQATRGEIDSLEGIMSSMQSPNDTLSKIDAVLGAKSVELTTADN